MIKNKFKYSFSVMTILIIACSSLQKFQPLEKDLPEAQRKMPGVTFADLQYGFTLYMEKCSGCHSLYHPDKYTATQWDTILPEMFDKAKITSKAEQLNIKQYLFSKARQ